MFRTYTRIIDAESPRRLLLAIANQIDELYMDEGLPTAEVTQIIISDSELHALIVYKREIQS